MSVYMEMLLAFFLLTGLMLASCSRLLHCIRIVVIQGVLLGILPLLTHGALATEQWLVAGINILIKSIVLPWLLVIAMNKAHVRRELEPIVGYCGSLIIALSLIGISFWIGSYLKLPETGNSLIIPVAFSILLTGLFIVMARRKAITQAIGFLTFENGISLFGTGLMVECGIMVELGILLDVFALVFIMGIAVLRINREFEHVDSDRLNQLGDTQTR